jgi:hypothetical protein
MTCRVAPGSCPGFLFPRRYTKHTKRERAGVETIAVADCTSPRSSTYVSGVSWTIPRHHHAPQEKPVPAESVAVCGRKLQSKGLGFGAKCNKPSRLHSLLTHRNVQHAGRRLKRAFRFRKVLWLLSSKESNNKNNLCSNSALCLRHGVGGDAPVLCVGLKPRRVKE